MRWHLTATLALAVSLPLAGCRPKAPEAPKPMFTGLKTEDTKVGDGPVAEEGDLALIQYTGRLAKTNAEFDTNDPRKSQTNKIPMVFRIGKDAPAVEGIWKGVMGMKTGGERHISMPYTLAYGADSTPVIPPYSDLVFDVKLLGVVKKGEEATVEVEDMQPGTGPEVKDGDRVEVRYRGTFLNGTPFDDTTKSPKPVSFQVGRKEAVAGFDKGILGMRQGGKRRMTLNPEAAWGVYGHDVIPGNQVLVYDVDLVSVKSGP